MTSHLIATATDDVVSTWELTREDAQLHHPQVIYESTTTPTAPSTMSSGYGTVNCLGWNHTQQVLACGTDDGAVALMLESGKMLEVLQEPTDARTGTPTPIISLSWGKRSRHLLTTGQGNRPSLWDLKGKERIMCFEGHDAPVSTVAFAPEDACVASGDNNGEIILHSIHSPKASMILPLDVTDDPAPRTPTGLKAAGVRSLHFWTARQPLLLAGHRDGVARVWDSTAGTCLMTFKGQHYMSIVAVAGSPASDKLVVTAGQDRKALLWDVTNRKLLKEVKAMSPITSMCFNPEGDMILLGLKNGDCSIYDIRNQHQPLCTTHAYQGHPIRALAVQQHAPRNSGHTVQNNNSSNNNSSNSSINSTELPPPPMAPKTPVAPRSAHQPPSTTSNTTTTSSSTAPAALIPAAATSTSSFPSSSSVAAGAMAKPVHAVQPSAPSAPLATPPPSGSSSSNGSSNSNSSDTLPSSKTTNASSVPSIIPSLKVSTNPTTAAAARRSPPPQKEILHTPAPVQQQQQQQQQQPQQVQPQLPAANENTTTNNNSNRSSSSSSSSSNAFRWRDKLHSSSSATAAAGSGHMSASATIAAAAARSTNNSINSKEVAQLVESKVKDMVDDLRDELARDLRGLHLELLRASENSQAAMQGLAQTFQALVEENRGLRREVEELQKQMEMPY